MHGNDLIKICLVANKADLEGKRSVSRDEAEGWARDHGLLYCEASAKSGKNVEEVFAASTSNQRAKRVGCEGEALIRATMPSLRGMVARGQRS